MEETIPYQDFDPDVSVLLNDVYLAVNYKGVLSEIKISFNQMLFVDKLFQTGFDINRVCEDEGVRLDKAKRWLNNDSVKKYIKERLNKLKAVKGQTFEHWYKEMWDVWRGKEKQGWEWGILLLSAVCVDPRSRERKGHFGIRWRNSASSGRGLM